MGRKLWACPAQTTWLLNRVDRFHDAQQSSSTPTFFSATLEEWFQSFPVPSDAIDEEREKLKVEFTNKIHNWFYNSKPNPGRSGVSSNALYLDLTKVPVKQGYYRQHTAYMTMYPNRLKLRADADYQKHCEEAEAAGIEPAKSLYRAYCNAKKAAGEIPKASVLWAGERANEFLQNHESDAVKARAQKLADEYNARRIELIEPEDDDDNIEGKAKNVKIDKEAAARTRLETAIEAVPRSLKRCLDNFYEQTGWSGTFIVGGPQPCLGGKLCLYIFHKGKTFELNNEWPATDDSFHTNVIDSYKNFLSAAYPPEQCEIFAPKSDNDNKPSSNDIIVVSNTPAELDIQAHVTDSTDEPPEGPQVSGDLLENSPADIHSLGMNGPGVSLYKSPTDVRPDDPKASGDSLDKPPKKPRQKKAHTVSKSKKCVEISDTDSDCDNNVEIPYANHSEHEEDAAPRVVHEKDTDSEKLKVTRPLKANAFEQRVAANKRRNEALGRLIDMYSGKPDESKRISNIFASFEPDVDDFDMINTVLKLADLPTVTTSPQYAVQAISLHRNKSKGNGEDKGGKNTIRQTKAPQPPPRPKNPRRGVQTGSGSGKQHEILIASEEQRTSAPLTDVASSNGDTEVVPSPPPIMVSPNSSVTATSITLDELQAAAIGLEMPLTPTRISDAVLQNVVEVAEATEKSIVPTPAVGESTTEQQTNSRIPPQQLAGTSPPTTIQWAESFASHFATIWKTPDWIAAIEGWREYEVTATAKHFYEFPLNHAPAEVLHAAKRLRTDDAVFEIERVKDGAEFGDAWWTWWRASQPEWRLALNQNARALPKMNQKIPVGHGLESLRCAGRLGLFVVVLGLAMWANAELATKQSNRYWTCAVADVTWVIRTLNNTAIPTKRASEGSDEPAPKR